MTAASVTYAQKQEYRHCDKKLARLFDFRVDKTGLVN